MGIFDWFFSKVVDSNNKNKTHNDERDLIKIIDLDYSKEDDLYYHNNELFTGFVSQYQHQNGSVSIKQEYRNGKREGKHTVYWSNGNKKMEYFECSNGEEKDKRYWEYDGSEMSKEDGEERYLKERDKILKDLLSQFGEGKNNNSNNEESDLFGYLNKELETDFKQSDYSIPQNLLNYNDEDGLYYFGNKIFSGYVIVDSFDNGKPKRIVEYKDGIEGGDVKHYYENGQLEVESCELEGIPTGLVKMYHENGQLSSETIFENGVPSGIGKHWNENGVLTNEITFQEGVPFKSKWYYENGNPKREEFDKKGKTISKCWDKDGNEIECEEE